MTDATPADAALDPEPAAAEPRVRAGWRRWVSAALFLLVAACFVLPFASTSCTLPGGYGRGVQGTSTVYRGIDLAFDAVPAVTPSDRPARPESRPNDGQLGFQPFALLALLAAVAGIVLALLMGARQAAGYAAGTAVVVSIAQWLAVTSIAGRIGANSDLPSGKSQIDYVSTGVGFVLALVLLAVLMAVNLVVIGWEARRSRALR
jgi:uncharacterized integral membrane protein